MPVPKKLPKKKHHDSARDRNNASDNVNEGATQQATQAKHPSAMSDRLLEHTEGIHNAPAVHHAGGAAFHTGHGHMHQTSLSSSQAHSAPVMVTAGNNNTSHQGSLRLPLNMLKVVLDELTDRISTEGPQLLESDEKSIGDFARQLQTLHDKMHGDHGAKRSTGSDVIAVYDDSAAHDVFVTADRFEPDASATDGEREGTENNAQGLEDWQEALIKIFKQLDADGSGSLSVQELRKALTEASVPIARVTKLIKAADADNSGEIELKEWMRAITESGDMEMRTISGKLQQKMTSGTLFMNQDRSRWYILHPTQVVRVTWDTMILLVCCYIAVVSPFVVAWEDTVADGSLEWVDMVDIVIAILFAVDILLNFITGYYSIDDELILDLKLIAHNYLRSWFTLDVLSTFPFNAVGLEAAKYSQAFKVLKLGKIFKFIKLMVHNHVDLADVSDYLDNMSTTKTWQMIIRRSTILVNMLLVCHWMACGMKIVDAENGGFLKSYQDVDGDVWAEYLAALYWSMTTLTTVGYGDICPTTDGERVFTITAMVVGGGFYGYVVGSICSMISNIDLNTTAFYDRMELIHAWVDHHKLPLFMKRRLRRHFKIYLQEKAALSEAEIWRDLTPELQREVGEFIVHQNVVANPMFDGLAIGTVVRLQSILQKVTVMADRVVCQLGEAGTAMYIVDDGCCQMKQPIVGKPDREVILGPGQSFGEEILLGLAENYEYSITTLEKTKLEMIIEDDFLALFMNTPNVLDRMRENAIDMNPQWGIKR